MFAQLLLWGITVQVLLGTGLGLYCAYLSWRGPRDPHGDFLPIPDADPRPETKPRLRHDTHFS
ncbi:hypothetical protein [Deinococcus depolymerans]|uniref:Uncharacterized protein n=1 Tax=Deinococcus depolymerans TaxID=392408 RepID=A0ABP3LJY5_9DEIO